VHARSCGADAEVRLTYDPSLPEYTIAIRVAEPWPEAPVFAMRFEGPQGNMISTGRHVLSDGWPDAQRERPGLRQRAGRAGVQRQVALAASGDRVVSIDLDGAAPEVAAFRACITAPSV
jgi:hypothetical protein